jgi:protein TonB
MKTQINNISLNFRCEADWNSMKNVDGAKFCNACNKKVYDFTDAKQQEFLQILAENSYNICGRFSAAQMAPIRVPVWQKWVSAALILIGINVFNSTADAQTGEPKVANKTIVAPDAMTVGVYSIESMAEFPGGTNALANFITKNIRYPKGAVDGKVFAQFTVTKDGSLTNFKIVRGINPINDQEVLRMLKLLPKWKPAINNGKAIDVLYTIPVSFQHR